MKTKEVKRREADLRNAAWRAFTIEQRFLILSVRPGFNRRQREKLLQKQNQRAERGDA